MSEHAERPDYKKQRHDPHYYDQMREFCILEPEREQEVEEHVEAKIVEEPPDGPSIEDVRPGSTLPLPEAVPINLVLPENMMVIPKITQTPRDMARNRRRSRWVRVKGAVSYGVAMILVILLVNVIWQVVTHPDLSLSDWLRNLGGYF
jgi:hypothetical protein